MQAGEKPLPPEDDNAIKEYLCIKAYLVSIYHVFRRKYKDKVFWLTLLNKQDHVDLSCMQDSGILGMDAGL